MTSDDNHQRLNAQDEYFLDTDTATAPTHIGGLEIYTLPPGAGRDFLYKYYQQIRRLKVQAEPFNYVLSTLEPEGGAKPGKSGGAPAWLQPMPRKKNPKPVRVWKRLDNVNPEEHIYLHALPYPGGQRELGELIARLHVNRLDRSRPLWEMHLIEGLEGGRYALYTKLHHSQFDGKRGMALTKYIRSTKPSTRGLPPIWAVDVRKETGSSASDKPTRNPAAAPSGSGGLQALASWGKALSKMRETREHKPGEGVIAPYSAPATILNGPLTLRRRFGTVSLPIPRIKALGAAVEGGATVNEILLAICGGALRRYLQDCDALPKDPLIAACPVAMARKEGAEGGNAVGQILASLGTSEANPKRRLLTVVESSRVNKSLMKELDTDVYDAYTQLSMMPQVLAAKTRFGHKVLNANLIISNVPGPRETQYVNGARLEAVYAASMLLPGQALNITVSNFGDNLDVGIMACPDLCPSPQRLAVYIGEELDVLERAMGIRPARVKKPAARKTPASNVTAKKVVAKKMVAKKVVAKKATAKKATVKKTTVKKTTAKKVVAKKPRSAARKKASGAAK